jgi:hypothetical protein
MSETRKLTAILVSDVGADEDRIQARQANRECSSNARAPSGVATARV